jgi:hypothetical protein
MGDFQDSFELVEKALLAFPGHSDSQELMKQLAHHFTMASARAANFVDCAGPWAWGGGVLPLPPLWQHPARARLRLSCRQGKGATGWLRCAGLRASCLCARPCFVPPLYVCTALRRPRVHSATVQIGGPVCADPASWCGRRSEQEETRGAAARGRAGEGGGGRAGASSSLRLASRCAQQARPSAGQGRCGPVPDKRL